MSRNTKRRRLNPTRKRPRTGDDSAYNTPAKKPHLVGTIQAFDTPHTDSSLVDAFEDAAVGAALGIIAPELLPVGAAYLPLVQTANTAFRIVNTGVLTWIGGVYGSRPRYSKSTNYKRHKSTRSLRFNKGILTC